MSSFWGSYQTYSDEEFYKAFGYAMEYLEVIRDEEEKNLEKINNVLVDNQIESIKQATDIKIKKARKS